MPKNENGKKGEDFAAELLLKNGYNVLKRNFHSRYGEIDIIARKGDIIAFVEVKTRAKSSWGTAAGAVTKSKQHKLILAAQYYLMTHKLDLIPRFDVIAITTEDADSFNVADYDHFEGAFDLNVQNGFY